MNGNDDSWWNELLGEVSSMGVDTTTDHSYSPTTHHSLETHNGHSNPFNGVLETGLDNALHSHTSEQVMSRLYSGHKETHVSLQSSTDDQINSSLYSTVQLDGLTDLTDNGRSLTDITNTSDAPYLTHSHYDSSQFHYGTIGHPEEKIQHWHEQIGADTCGVVTQGMAIEDLTGKYIPEEQLCHQAQGSYIAGIGTPSENFGKLISEITHIPVESHYGGTISEIADKLNHNQEVFIGVNESILQTPDSGSILGKVAPNLFDPQHFAGESANHIVQVIGINNDDLSHPKVIINDPGVSDGRGIEVPVEQFQQAMDASHGFIASTVLNSLDNNHHSQELIFGCKVTWNDYRIDIDEYTAGYYKGNSFYWDYNYEKVAGTWSCDTHHAYTKNGTDLGYAKTWSDAALLIFKQNS